MYMWFCKIYRCVCATHFSVEIIFNTDMQTLCKNSDALGFPFFHFIISRISAFSF